MSVRKIATITSSVSIYRDTDLKEYEVRLAGRPEADYFTNDKEDAFDTAYDMAAQQLIVWFKCQGEALTYARAEADRAGHGTQKFQTMTRVATTVRTMPRYRVEGMLRGVK